MEQPKSTIPNLQSFSALRRFVRERPTGEQCDLCSAPVAAEHPHLIELANRQIVCACDPCAILFSGGETTRYRRIPRRIRFLRDFQLTDAQWDSLAIPINLAFLFHSTPRDRVITLYPSPAGATESLLDLRSWDELLRDNPILNELEPDVEALLVHRIGPMREHYLAPIDTCYELVGLIRANWRGLSGGTEVWAAINQFFARLKERSDA